jgi:hypothetical protein
LWTKDGLTGKNPTFEKPDRADGNATLTHVNPRHGRRPLSSLDFRGK